MGPTTITILALTLAALALLLIAGSILVGHRRRDTSTQVVRNALARNLPDDLAQAAAQAPRQADAQLPMHWLGSRLGRLLVADEDRRLIEQSGLRYKRTQIGLMLLRLTLAPGLPLLALMAFGHMTKGTSQTALLLGTAFVIGFMLPKWLLVHLAARRRSRIARELPLFVDLLGLLQGVGLSLDQSLQVVAADFTRVLPVLSNEVAVANRQYAQGRTREQAFHRLAQLYGNQNLADLTALLVQVDRHGGAVAEPLRQFCERLRVQRKSEMKARIGKITVKMTVVMVATLLPALIIVTAGPGFLAIIRSVAQMGGSS